jgi:AcrR family transcriptional regulator
MPAKRLTRVEQRQQTRERLLDAAVEVFSQRGFHAASVEEIAEWAGFSKGAVYSNFASKEDLFLALFDRRIAHEVENWPTIKQHINQPVADQQPVDHPFIASILRDKTWNLLLMEFVLYAIREESARQQFADRLTALRSLMQQELAKGFETTGFRPTMPVDHLPWVIFALGMGLSIQAYLDPTAFPADLYQGTLEQTLR